MAVRFVTRSKIKSAVSRATKTEGRTITELIVGKRALQAYPELFERLSVPVRAVDNHSVGVWGVRLASEYNVLGSVRRDQQWLGVARPTWLEEGEDELWGSMPSYWSEEETVELLERLRGDLIGWLAHELEGLQVPVGAEVAVDPAVYTKLAATHEVRGEKVKLRTQGETRVYAPYVDVAGRRVRCSMGDLRSRNFSSVHSLAWKAGWVFTAPMERFTTEEREYFHRLRSDMNNQLNHDQLIGTSRALAR